MDITDLTGYTWVGNDILNLKEGTVYFDITFASNNEMYDRFITMNRITPLFSLYGADYVHLDSSTDNLVYSGVWIAEAYKTIEITGGTDATNPTLIAWLEANGTLTKGGEGSTLDVTYNSQKIIDSLEVTPPVTVTYNGSTIATLNEGDTKTLQCNGKVMASNVVIGDKTLQCNGKLMASDVVIEVGGVTPTGETWVINEVVQEPINLITADINFNSNQTAYRVFIIDFSPRGFDIWYSNDIAYSDMWIDQAYRTVTFETPPTGDLLTWLEANAIKQ